jgi:hypothetical protein
MKWRLGHESDPARWGSPAFRIFENNPFVSNVHVCDKIGVRNNFRVKRRGVLRGEVRILVLGILVLVWVLGV